MNDNQHAAYQAARARQREKLARWLANHAGDKPRVFKVRTLMPGERRLGPYVGPYVENPEPYPEPLEETNQIAA